MNQITQFIINHWLLWVALLGILSLILINERLTQKKQGKALSPAAAVDLINNQQAIVFDLREGEPYRAGHIINSILVSQTELEQKRLEKHKNTPVLLVCAKGLQSPTVAIKLHQKGFTQVTVLSGGVAAWQAAGLPLVKGKA